MSAAFHKTLGRNVAEAVTLGSEVKEFLERSGASGRAIYKVRLALEEMVLNLIDHATGSLTQRIDVRVDVEPERVVIVIEDDGDPSVRVRLEPTGPHFDGATTTAMPVVNAIPGVVAAPPGVVNRMDLPFVKGAHLLTRTTPNPAE